MSTDDIPTSEATHEQVPVGHDCVNIALPFAPEISDKDSEALGAAFADTISALRALRDRTNKH